MANVEKESLDELFEQSVLDHPSAEELALYHDKVTDRFASARIGAHLKRCRICSSWFEEMQSFLAAEEWEQPAEAHITFHHPSGEEALRFLAGELPESAQALVRRHLESGCSECRPLFGIKWLQEHARRLLQEGTRLLRESLKLPAPSFAFASKDEPAEFYRQEIESSGLVILAEQDHGELLVRIRATDTDTAFRSVYVAVLSAVGTLEAVIPWEPGYWPAQHRFPDFNRLVMFGDSVSIVVSPIPLGADLLIEGDK